MACVSESWRWICNWITRMGERWGGTVYGGEPRVYGMDWGQALCFAFYGEGWPSNPQYLRDNDAGEAPAGVIELAKRWEAGEWPAGLWTGKRPRPEE